MYVTIENSYFSILQDKCYLRMSTWLLGHAAKNAAISHCHLEIIIIIPPSGRADPNCALGHLLKALFKNDNFMSKVGM